MWTGRQTLERIESTISNLHRQEGELDSAMRSAAEDAEPIRKDRRAAYRELARVKLDEITARRLVDNLDAAELRAAAMLEDRRQQIDTITGQRQRLITDLERAEKERSAAAAALEAVVNELQVLREKIEATIKASPAWQRTQSAVEAAQLIAAEADKKATQWESELTEKRKPYDDDRLFKYLWSIGFGTSQYRGSLIGRIFDRMAARYIGYLDARPNYAMLLEIPVRLREHAKVQQAIVEQRRAEQADVEAQALSAAGSGPLEQSVQAERKRLAAVDKTVEATQAELRTLDQKRDALVDGKDTSAYDEALTMIASADAHDDLATLMREARRTATEADDAIVRRIGDLNARIERIDREVVELRRSAKTIAERRVEVERTRDRFRGAGYDHPNATFENESQLGKVLAQILEGVVRSGILWDLIRAGFGLRYPRGRPDFGGDGSFPFPLPRRDRDDGPRGGEWRRPNSQGGWIPPIGFPSGGSRRRDDDDDRFTTGGSF